MLSKRLYLELFLTITLTTSALSQPSCRTPVNAAIRNSVESLIEWGLLPGDGHHFPHDTAEDQWPCTTDARQRSTTMTPPSCSVIEPVGHYVLPS